MRVSHHPGVNMLPGSSISRMLILFSLKRKNILWSWFIDGDNMLNHIYIRLFDLILFSPKRKHILWSWFIYRTNMLNHLIITRIQKNVTCFRYIWQWIRLFIDNCLMILAWYQCPYNWDYYCFVCISPW